MARPKTVKDGRKLNLYLPKATKSALFALATDRGESLSAVVTDLIDKASLRRKPARS